MHSPRTVKALLSPLMLAACAHAPPPASNPSTRHATSAANPAAAQAPAAPTPEAAPTLTAPTAQELDALRPLLSRGPAILVRDVDGGSRARITFVVRAHAPIATVHHVVSTPGEYMTFMPTLRSVDVISTHGSRTAFRFHVAAPMFDVTALSAMNVISDHRVDVAVIEAETGPGGSRWDLTRDGANDTIVSLTTWGDPSQGHWLLRQMARRSPTAIAGMNISADAVLGLGVVRRAEILTGATSPMRPVEGSADPGTLAPPPSGPWLALTRDATVLSVSLTPEGSVTQVTVASTIAAEASAVMDRLRDVPNYPRVWGSVQSTQVLGGDDVHGLRYRSIVDTPISHLEGEQSLRIEGATAWQEGVGGDYLGSSHRWDVVAAPGGGNVVMLTGASDYNRAGWLTRALMARDPWLMAGFAGSWKIVWLRHLVRGL